MIRLRLRSPVWKTMEVGVSPTILRHNENIIIEITYRNKKGELVFPDLYFFRVKNAYKFPRRFIMTKSKYRDYQQEIELIMIPLSKLPKFRPKSRK
jgi:hypothetical protein